MSGRFYPLSGHRGATSPGLGGKQREFIPIAAGGIPCAWLRHWGNNVAKTPPAVLPANILPVLQIFLFLCYLTAFTPSPSSLDNLFVRQIWGFVQPSLSPLGGLGLKLSGLTCYNLSGYKSLLVIYSLSLDSAGGGF